MNSWDLVFSLEKVCVNFVVIDPIAILDEFSWII